jgi:DNA-binding LacI/PurR family transcriptional regulator
MSRVTPARTARPTIDDVARAANVSRTTVSRVLNDAPGASEAIRRRVRTTADELGYRPSEAARALASGRPRTVDLIAVGRTSDTSWLGTHPYYSRVLAGALSVLEGSDTRLHIHALDPAAAEDAIDAAAASATVGALLANTTPELAERFHRRCPRVVSLVPTAPTVPALEADNTGGAYTAVRHLHRLGRRHIAAIHGPEDNSCAAYRRTGYRRAVDELGLPDLRADGGFTREGGHNAVLRLLERHPEIDALFVASDLMAAGAVQAITATARRVPEDISIIGFDDSIAATCANPPLSTMRLPVEQMAAEATRMLLNHTFTPGYRKHYPVELVERASTVRAGTG